MPKAIEIFRQGRHTAMSGERLAFGEADLLASAAAYDPAIHEAPLVVGHPQTDAPAYGWVAKLSFAQGANGGSLEAEPTQIDPAFAEMVGKGRFKKISAAFYRPDAPNNPKPGVYYLRHVGFLGAQPPAVKGLRSPEFAGSADDIVVFGDWNDRQIVGLFRGIRDFMIAQFGQDTADRAIPSYTIDALADDAAQPDTSGDDSMSGQQPNYAEREEALAKREAEVKRKEEDQKKADAEFAERARIARRGDHAAFIDGLVAKGKALPAFKAMFVEFMEFAHGAEALTFGEGDKAVTKPMLAAFKEFLEAQPKAVEFDEVAGRRSDVDAAAAATTLDLPPGVVVDRDRLALHGKALAYQEKHQGVSFIQAVIAVGGAA